MSRTIVGCQGGERTLDPALSDPNCADHVLAEFLAKDEGVVWVDLEAPTEADYAWLSERFHFHPLAIEDCRHGVQRPKIDEYVGYLFFVFHAVTGIELKRQLRLDVVELDGFLGTRYLVTVHDEPLSIVTQVQARVAANPSLLARGTDDLFYTLLDAAVDLYFPLLDQLDSRIDDIEQEIFVRPTRRTLLEVFNLRKAILKLRRFAWPQRDTLSLLAHREHEAIDERTRYYLRDVVDHLIRITDALDAYRDVVSGAADTYISHVSQRTNDTIKVLSIIATILLPLSFIAGLYGMNFEHLPGASHRFGFQIMVGAMTVLVLVILGIFRWRRWI
jgi:magnesium transporter